MKEKLKTIALIILLLLSLILIIGCKAHRYIVICPGHSLRSISIIKSADPMIYDHNTFTEQFERDDSIFSEKYDLPTTR